MHHSIDPDKRTFAVTCYLDESGTHGDSPQAIVAGWVLNRDSFLMFDVVWNNMLSQFAIESPLHMKEFGKHGRLGHLSYPDRYALFDQVAKIIDYFKIHSVAFVLDQAKFNKIIDLRIRKHMGVYGACFMGCAHLVFLAARDSQYHKDIAFLLEQGNEHACHILNAHTEMVRIQRERVMPIHVGSLAFEHKRISALQAADVIAWGVRRRVTKTPIGKGFQPIAEIFSQDHIQKAWEEDWLQSLNDSILNKSVNDSNIGNTLTRG